MTQHANLNAVNAVFCLLAQLFNGLVGVLQLWPNDAGCPLQNQR